MRPELQLLQAIAKGEVKRVEIGNHRGNWALYSLGEPQLVVDEISYSELKRLARAALIELPMVGEPSVTADGVKWLRDEGLTNL